MQGAAIALLLLLYDANGVALGASEREVRERFPSAYCKPLEWTSEAADRRCDDARIRFEGVKARITFYLREDAVEAFDVRFDPREAGRLAAALKKAWGAPVSEGREVIRREGEEARELYKVLWKKAGSRAALSAEGEARRASLRVWRGEFEQEIYRVR